MSFRRTLNGFRIVADTVDAEGFKVSGAQTVITVFASVQSAKKMDIETLPEGRRNSKARRLYTDDNLNTLENGNPDIVIINNEEYEVTKKMEWENDVINHSKYIVTRMIKDD